MDSGSKEEDVRAFCCIIFMKERIQAWTLYPVVGLAPFLGGMAASPLSNVAFVWVNSRTVGLMVNGSRILGFQ